MKIDKCRKAPSPIVLIVCALIIISCILVAIIGVRGNTNDSQVIGSVENAERCPVSFFLSDLQFIDSNETIPLLKECGASIITVPLVWRFLEENRGEYDPTEYYNLLEPYVDAGFKFIFIIDAGNRYIMDNNNEFVAYCLPDWLLTSEACTRQVDFLGQTQSIYGFSYSDPKNQELLLSFCKQTIDCFGEKYKDSLIGFAPCITSEVEIKYPQTQYAYTDYSDEALARFREYLQSKYTTIEILNSALNTSYSSFGDIELPIINYRNTIISGQLNDDPLFENFMRFRETALVDFITPVYQLIHDNGYTNVAYFGQTISPHDSIYAAGVSTQLADYVDIAVIDFNFYNGYNEDYNSIIPAMLVNYLKNSGYKTVWAGLYYERIPYLDHLDFLQKTVDFIAADGLADGYEIGGIFTELSVKGKEAAPNTIYGITRRGEQAKIAIYLSEWNFYKSHGEELSHFDYFLDGISQMYKIVRFELDYPVDILCDKAILNNRLQDYDCLIIPTQYYVDPEVRSYIEEYINNGGKAIMDFRFGEWNSDGTWTGEWSDEAFGIGGKEYVKDVNLDLLSCEGSPAATIKNYALRTYYSSVPVVYYLCSNADNAAKPLFNDINGNEIGLYTENTVVIGFQPQIQYRYCKDNKEREDAVKLIKQLIDYLL